MPHIRGWVGGSEVERVKGRADAQATNLCAQWARQMETTAMTIPRAMQTYNGTELDSNLPYQCPSIKGFTGSTWSFVT